MTDLDELERLYAEATEGLLKWGWRDDHDAPGSIFAETRTGHAYAVAMCPRYGKKNFRHDAPLFVALHNAFPALATELRALREFAADMFDASDWPDGGDIDGFEFQEAAIKRGILIPETRRERCGERCHCAENHSESEMKDGVTCYRKPEWLQSVGRPRN